MSAAPPLAPAASAACAEEVVVQRFSSLCASEGAVSTGATDATGATGATGATDA